MPEEVIVIRNLTKKFGRITAVNGLNLTVHRGDVFGFLGPNGAGKSTTIRMMLGLVRPSSGSINIFGQPLQSDRKTILSRVGAIVEKPDFYIYLTAFQNLKLLANISGRPIADSRIWEMLETVGLADRARSKVKSFSHGMKQRLGIAQALLHDPDLIILDEPTTGLDPQGMKEIRDLIRQLSREQGKTIFLSSHILKEIEEVATRVVIIDKGSARIEGEVNELLNRDLSVTFRVNDVQRAQNALAQTPFKEHLTEVRGSQLIFSVTEQKIPGLIHLLTTAGIKITAVIPRRSLEDFFLKITEESRQ